VKNCLKSGSVFKNVNEARFFRAAAINLDDGTRQLHYNLFYGVVGSLSKDDGKAKMTLENNDLIRCMKKNNRAARTLDNSLT